MLLPGTDAAAARRKIDALRRRWRSEALLLGPGGSAGSSFSAGVADTRLAGSSVAALLKRADDELLCAKREGRNRVRAAQPPAAVTASAA